MRSNPTHAYQPAIARIFQALRERADANGELVISNRALAQLAGCSEGFVPAIMRQFEADGVLERATAPGKAGTHIRLLNLDAAPERVTPEARATTARAVASHGVRPAGPNDKVDLVAQLERLAGLKERGALTDEEFALAKAKLLH